jgi:hypothetical protein
MKSSKEQLKEFSEKIKGLFLVIGLRAFLIILLFIILGLFFGIFIFYNYAFLAKNILPETTESIIKFDDKIYNGVMEKIRGY